MLVALYFVIFKARRGAIFMCATSLASGIMIYFIYSRNKAMMIVMSLLFVSITSIYFAGNNMPSVFNFLMERGDEDTRSGVEDYLAADMSDNDWIFGKGYNGKYFCPGVGDVTDTTGMGYRDIIETGYLQIVLTGGYITLGLLILILFPAIYLGLFRSKNVLSKSAAIWIFLWVIYEYPTVGVAFTMHYILVWISVGICYSKVIRMMPDSTIKVNLQGQSNHIN
jgi:hypothetical protein